MTPLDTLTWVTVQTDCREVGVGFGDDDRRKGWCSDTERPFPVETELGHLFRVRIGRSCGFDCVKG